MKNKLKVFSQDIAPYRKEILVSIGAETKDILDYVNKKCTKQAKKDFPEIIKQHRDLFDRVKTEKNGYALHFVKDGRSYLILLLRKFEDTWVYWETLLHELSHIIDWVVEDCMLEKETEARAYLHEHLFNRIRRKLQGTDKL